MLAVPPSPRDVAERSEALRPCHVSRMARILSTQSSLASLLLALLARALPRADVALCGRDERARASCGASVDSIREAQFSLDDVVHEVVWDVVIVAWRWIHRTRRLACDGDDDRVAPDAGAPEPDFTDAILLGPMPQPQVRGSSPTAAQRNFTTERADPRAVMAAFAAERGCRSVRPRVDSCQSARAAGVSARASRD